MMKLKDLAVGRGEDMARQARCYNRDGSSRASVRCKSLRRVLRKVWLAIREWSGDAAYERYLRSPRTRAHTAGVLSPAEFYVEQLDRRYSRPNRCC
jgi:uncharacterized short protein YbdD (DUF466 family)